MTDNLSYKQAFMIALGFHFFLGFMLFFESQISRPALNKEVRNVMGELTALDTASSTKPKPEIVKAVSVNEEEVTKTVNRLKEERAMTLKNEQLRQKALADEATKAKKLRVQEQQRIQQLKNEAAKLALVRKKQIEEEQTRLKQVAAEKEKKELLLLKKEQQALEQKRKQDVKKLAELKDQQEAQKKALDAAKEKERLAQTQKESNEKAALDAAEKARIAGEVDKYKAMIVNAIGRRWILPDNVDSSLSSQFRIRLGPDGTVQEVSLMKSSGDAILDRSAETAIYKASPLPVPSDPHTFNLFRDISLTVRPENVRG